MRQAKSLAWALWVAIRVGETAWKLAVEHRAGLDPRLPAGMIDGLGADVASLKDAGSGAQVARVGKRTATLTQGEAKRAGHDLALAIRSAVRRGEPDDEAFQKAFGVGVTVVAAKVSSVDSALSAILKAAEADAERTRGVGILPEDLDEVRRVKEALTSAESTQEGQTVSAKMATSARDEAQRRVQKAVWRVVGAAGLAFRGQLAIAKLFADVIPGHLPEEQAPTSAPAAPATPGA